MKAAKINFSYLHIFYWMTDLIILETSIFFTNVLSYKFSKLMNKNTRILSWSLGTNWLFNPWVVCHLLLFYLCPHKRSVLCKNLPPRLKVSLQQYFVSLFGCCILHTPKYIYHRVTFSRNPKRDKRPKKISFVMHHSRHCDSAQWGRKPENSFFSYNPWFHEGGAPNSPK